MLLAKVLERVVSSAKHERLPARALLSVEPLEGFGDRTPMIAIDTVQAGPGDIVLLLMEGTGVRQVVQANPSDPLPSQVAIVGIVDDVHLA
jgi:microcompartment protein CcmK/EutM